MKKVVQVQEDYRSTKGNIEISIEICDDGEMKFISEGWCINMSHDCTVEIFEGILINLARRAKNVDVFKGYVNGLIDARTVGVE